MWSRPVAQRWIVLAGCLAMAYTQLTMSPATIEFARRLGANGLHFGILGALPTGMLFMQFLAAVAANHLRYRRWLWFTTCIVQRLIFLPVALGPLLLPDVSDVTWVWVLILTTALNHAMIDFSTPLWLSWMGDYLPHAGLNRYWGMRQLWMQWTAALSLAAGAVFLLKSGLPLKLAFASMIGIGAILGILDILLFLKVEEPPVSPAPSLKLRNVLTQPFRDRDFRRFIGFTCFWHFAAMSGAPFISLFLLVHVGMDLFHVLLLWAFSWVGGAVLSNRLGMLAEEYGNRPILVLCTAFKSVNMLALILVPQNPVVAFYWLVPVFMFDAVMNSGIAIANNGFLIKNSPAGNRSMFIAAGTAMAGMVGGVTSIVCGLALKHSGELHFVVGSKPIVNFHLLFLLSLVSRWVAVYLTRYLREPKSHDTVQVVTCLIGITPLRVLRFPMGLYRTFSATTANGEKPALPVVEDVPVVAAAGRATADVRS